MYTAKGQLDRDALIRRHVPLVRRIESEQGVQFETFASQRIRGAMLDELREGDWMSRSSRKSQKDIEHALHRLEQRLGRTPLESEIADELGMDLDDYQSLLGKVRGTQLVYLEDMSGGDEGEDFLERHVADSGADPFALLRDHRLRVALVHHGHVLRARHEPQGNRRRAGRDRIACVPAAQPGDCAPAYEDAGALKAPPEPLRGFPLSTRFAGEGDDTLAAGRPLLGVPRFGARRFLALHI
jgi:RNA polymerase sigma factor FliA